MKRFYDKVDVAEVTGGWQVTLDGRGIKTIKGAPQLLPNRSLAAAVGREWENQESEIDMSRFVLRDQIDYAIDIVQSDRAATVATLLKFGETDTLCYRADPDEPLFARQQEVWEPLLNQIEKCQGVSFTRVSGIIHRPQPDETLQRLGEHLTSFDHFHLAGLHTMTSLSASLVIGLLALNESAKPDELWQVANLEEEWQAELWGRDEEAEARRAKRQEAFLAAAEFVRLLRS